MYIGPSLLGEGEDTRPIYGCMTLYEHTWALFVHAVNRYVGKMLRYDLDEHV
jgi:hypothetical protein